MNKRKVTFISILVGIVCAGILLIVLDKENLRISSQNNSPSISALKVNENIQCYEGFEVKYRGNTKKFEDWRQMTDYMPEAELFHQNEYIFIPLTLGRGTGVLEQNVHILDAKTLNEIAVENPKQYILGNIDEIKLSGVPEENNELQVICKGKKIGSYKVPEDVITSGMYDGVEWGSLTTYRIEDDMLYASLSGFASPSLCIGMLELRYELAENEFKIADISFIPAE